MGWSRVQGTGDDSGGEAASVDATFGAPVSAGNLIRVAVASDVQFCTSMAVADDGGNTYDPVAVEDQGGVTVWIFEAAVTTGGHLTVVATPGSEWYLTIAIDEFSPGGGAIADAGTAAANGSGTASVSVGPIAYSGNGLIYLASAINAVGGAVSPGSGYTLGYSIDFIGSVHYGLTVVYKLDDASGSAVPSLSYADTTTYVAAAAVATATAPVVPAGLGTGGHLGGFRAGIRSGGRM